MPRGFAETPSSVEIENLGGTTLHIVNFDTVLNSPGSVYNSSLNSVVGYWFNPTDTATTASNMAVDVSLISAATGQFRFTGPQTVRTGKLYVLTLT